ncbi:MAG TPA: ATP-dependent DNA ligase [Streptosporangiaceae bacterium]
MLLNEIALVSAEVAQVSGRRAKIDLIAGLLARAEGAEVPLAVAFLSGELRQRQIGVGYAALSDLLAPRPEPDGPAPAAAATEPEPAEPVPQATPAAAAPELTVAEADQAFDAIGQVTGAGSQAERRRLLAALFARATEAERSFLIQLVAGELRQGALEGVMIEAVAQAAEVPAAEVRRALLVGGSLPAVAQAALTGTADPLATSQASGRGDARSEESGKGTSLEALDALRSFALRVGRPLRPMLAAAAPSIEAAMQKLTPAAVEWKIDGIRVQVHKDADRVTVFTRTLDDITARVPEIVEAVRGLPAAAAVLDGEAVALFPDGRPRPFQITASRAGTQAEASARHGDVPLTPFFFDLLHLDGTDLIDTPAAERHAALAGLLPAALVIPRIVADDPAAAEAFFADAVARGHEGVVLKSLDGPYATGRRGSEWIKVKPRHTLDLVVLAAEWGHGRRRGWLSNLHLGARDPATGDLVMLGKTFKGLTDKILGWQTTRLLELAVPGSPPPPADLADARGVVRVRPELVVEIAFDGVQVSRRYPGGLALRFARVIRYRPDKKATEADTIDQVRAVAPVITEPEPTN